MPEISVTVTADASVIRGCCGKPDTDCDCQPVTTIEENL